MKIKNIFCLILAMIMVVFTVSCSSDKNNPSATEKEYQKKQLSEYNSLAKKGYDAINPSLDSLISKGITPLDANGEYTNSDSDKSSNFHNKILECLKKSLGDKFKGMYFVYLKKQNDDDGYNLNIQYRIDADSEIIGEYPSAPENYEDAAKLEWGNFDNSDEESNYRQVVNGKGATLTVYTNRDDRVKDNTLPELTKEFEKANNCKVEYKIPEKYDDAISKKLISGHYGDVVFMPDNLTKDNVADYFESLGNYDELSTKYRWADQKMTDDGNVYGLAIGGSVTGLLYNKKIWGNAGYYLEKDNLPKTPEDFIKALKDIKKSNPDCCPILTDIPDNWVISKWNDWAVSASGDPAYNQRLLDEDTDILNENSYYYKVNKLMFDVLSDKSLREDEIPDETMWNEAKSMLPQGEVGCMVLGSWAIRQFKDKADKNLKENVGFMPIPFTAPDGKQYSEITPDYFLGVSNKSQHKELAKAYVQWFIEYSGFPESETMVSTDMTKSLPEDLVEWNGKVEFFEAARASYGYDGIFNQIYNNCFDLKNAKEYSGVFSNKEQKIIDKFISPNDSRFDHYTYLIAQAGFNYVSEKEFTKICTACNKSWKETKNSIYQSNGLK